MSFQTQVNINQAPAVEGDFADKNPRASVIAGPGALVVGDANGITVGRFAWFTAAGLVSQQSANPAASDYGFVPRRQQAMIVNFLAESSMNIPTGQPVTLFSRGSFWGRFAAGATFMQKVYFSYADGSLSAGATGAPATSTFTANTTSGSATITVTALAGGNVIALGQPVSGTGIPAGAYISAFGTGTGGGGTYTISANATATGTGVTVTNTTTKETTFTVAQTVGAGELAKFTSGAL